MAAALARDSVKACLGPIRERHTAPAGQAFQAKPNILLTHSRRKTRTAPRCGAPGVVRAVRCAAAIDAVVVRTRDGAIGGNCHLAPAKLLQANMS
ncbi:hypothetical protein J5T34_20335 [Cupriavidus gilardii]|uniref:hypothetical protein n=1 Tax=Cupriavidus gilardii TaxID=82541 RepID=UPI001ABE5280|nr:hypothetical protein [Cupriavidus gilardii]MBO4123081.1 hypothetical protein [Cupriavidus gilardii]